MKLKELMEQIKRNFLVDEQLRAYLYKDVIRFIDYTSGYTLSNGEELEPHYGSLLNIYLEGNKISYIECDSINLITPANANLIKFVASLVNIEIEDYDSYNYLPSFRDIEQSEIKRFYEFSLFILAEYVRGKSKSFYQGYEGPSRELISGIIETWIYISDYDHARKGLATCFLNEMLENPQYEYYIIPYALKFARINPYIFFI